MTRPLGYSVERQDDGRIRIIRTSTCWRCVGVEGRCEECRGERRVDTHLVVTAERARTLRDALTAALGETSERTAIVAWLRKEPRAIGTLCHRGCGPYPAGVERCPNVVAGKVCGKRLMTEYESRPEDRDEIAEAIERGAFLEVPAAPVASEGPAKGAGSSTPERARVLCEACDCHVYVDTTSSGCIQCPSCDALLCCNGCGMDISGGPWLAADDDLRCAECVKAEGLAVPR